MDELKDILFKEALSFERFIESIIDKAQLQIWNREELIWKDYFLPDHYDIECLFNTYKKYLFRIKSNCINENLIKDLKSYFMDNGYLFGSIYERIDKIFELFSKYYDMKEKIKYIEGFKFSDNSSKIEEKKEFILSENNPGLENMEKYIKPVNYSDNTK